MSYSLLKQTVWMSHSDKVIEIPDGFEVIADSPRYKLCTIEDKKRRIYGVHSILKYVIQNMVMIY